MVQDIRINRAKSPILELIQLVRIAVHDVRVLLTWVEVDAYCKGNVIERLKGTDLTAEARADA